MNKKIALTVLFFIFFSASLNAISCSESVFTSSETIWVPDNYETIQGAIDAAGEGYTVQVRAGTYYEHLSITKPLKLVGENKHETIIDGNGTGIVIRVTANNINISGFTIQKGESGILSWDCSNNVISDNIISNNLYGIWSWNCSNNVISDNIISNNSRGISLSYSINNVISGNTASNNSYGIYLFFSNNNTFTSNAASNNQYGIYVGDSDNNILTGDTATSNQYGTYLWRSDNNVLSGNTAISNQYGTYLWRSDNNILSDDTAISNQYGIYLDESGYNTLTSNTVSSNNDDGIHLYHSDNNVLSGNAASNNQYGIYVGDSDNNILTGDTATSNQYGIHLYYSRDTILTGNTAASNQYGISCSSSSNNVIFHNNFIDNTEPTSNIDSVNSWDNGAEGNYWSNYPGTDADRDGIGDAPYTIDKNSKDNYPLMAMFLQFNIATEKKQSYKITTVCNSTISNFQYRYDPYNRTNAVSFEVNGNEGTGFCRICIPHTLIEPPHTVRVNHNSPLYFKIVYTNGTHTWLYFTYNYPEQEVLIMHLSYPEQLVWSKWAIVGLTVIIGILLSISIRYYRLFNKQKKVIQAYERELGSFPLSHPERARVRFIKDVIERKEKIERFKKKYGIKIQPADTLEDLMKRMGVQKES